MEDLQDRLRQVLNAISAAALKSGRKPEDITLIGVTKLFPPEVALQAFQAGILNLAENRVQDLLAKQDWLAASGLQPNWHLIGTLQRNKVRHIIGRTCLVHSADSVELLEEISRRSLNKGCITDVLLQVNSSGEESKHGFSPDQLSKAAGQAASMPGIRIRGLMTMAQLTANPDETRPVFEKTKVLFDQVAKQLDRPDTWRILSMGMSQDYVQAIESGATHVRVGSALFGPRPIQTA